MNGAKRDAAVFLAHYFDAEVEERFRKLQREASTLCDVTLLVENDVAVPESLKPFALTFDFSGLRAKAASVIGDAIVPGNCHLRSIDLFERSPGYRHYWFVEYDVVYTGHWGRFLASFAEDDSDLLAAHLRTEVTDRNWYWWGTLATGAERCPPDERVTAFLPVHRISARALGLLRDKVRDGWTGHFEALVPTALAHAGLGMADIGGNGPWTPKERVGRHYLDWDGSLYAGTLRYRPPVRWRPVRGMLYHPCKTRIAPDPRSFRERTDDAIRRGPPLRYWITVLRLAVRSRLAGAKPLV